MPGSRRVANLYSNHYSAIEDPKTPTVRKIALHSVDALGLAHPTPRAFRSSPCL